MTRDLTLHLGLLAVLYFLHVALPDYHHGQVARIMVLAVYAMGYNILFGYSGLLSLGHAMFFAAGMYGMGLSAQHLDMPILPAFAIGIAAATLLAFIVGLLALRTIGVGFMIVTLMFAQSAYLTISVWHSPSDQTLAGPLQARPGHGRGAGKRRTRTHAGLQYMEP